jgi:hypothetical protein
MITPEHVFKRLIKIMCKQCGSCSKEHGRSLDDAVDEAEASIL